LELNAEWAHARQLYKYKDFENAIEATGFSVRIYTVEVGARGFCRKSLRGFLTAMGCSNRKIKKTVKECCEAAERASVRICASRNDTWSQEEV